MSWLRDILKPTKEDDLDEALKRHNEAKRRFDEVLDDIVHIDELLRGRKENARS